MIRLELRRGGGWAIALGAAALTVVVARGGMFTDVWLWPQATHGVLYSAVLVGPLAAAAGAWWSGRDRRAGVEGFLDAHARPPAARSAARMAALGVWVAAGQLVGVAVVFVPTAVHATSGGPWWAPVVALLAFVQACMAAGFILGTTRLPSWLAAGLAAFTVYGLVGFTAVSTGHGAAVNLVASLSPVDFNLWVFTTDLRTRAELLIPLTQLGLAAALAGGLLTRQRAGRGLAAGTAVAAVVLLSGLGALVTDPQGPTTWEDHAARDQYREALQAGREPHSQPSVTCQRNRTVEVCMLAAWSPLADQVAHAITPTLAPIVEATRSPVRAMQVLSNPHPLPRWSDGTVPFALPLGGSGAQPFGTATLVAGSVVGAGCGPDSSLLGEDMGPDRPRGFPDPNSPLLAQRVVAEWLLRQAGREWTYGPPLDVPTGPDATRTLAARLADATTGVPRATWVAWLDGHLDALRACQITASDLPLDLESP